MKTKTRKRSKPTGPKHKLREVQPGERFGYLEFVGYAGRDPKSRHMMALCVCHCPVCVTKGVPPEVKTRASRLLAPNGSGEEVRSCGTVRSLRFHQFVDGQMAGISSAVRAKIFMAYQRGKLRGNARGIAQKFRLAHVAIVHALVHQTVKELKDMAVDRKHYNHLMLHLRRQREAGAQQLDMTQTTNLFALEEAKKLIAEKGHLEDVSNWVRQDLETAKWAVEAAGEALRSVGESPAQSASSSALTSATEIIPGFSYGRLKGALILGQRKNEPVYWVFSDQLLFDIVGLRYSDFPSFQTELTRRGYIRPHETRGRFCLTIAGRNALAHLEAVYVIGGTDVPETELRAAFSGKYGPLWTVSAGKVEPTFFAALCKFMTVRGLAKRSDYEITLSDPSGRSWLAGEDWDRRATGFGCNETWCPFACEGGRIDRIAISLNKALTN